MAFLDTERGCYVVRIVYDGPGLAGKTTNLQRICDLVPATKRTEMVTPGALKGRTMFFDWLELDGPENAPMPIKVQLITVPGQEQRNYRRRPLIDMADVVVFVADTSTQQLPDTLRTFARLRVSMRRRERAIPLVIQANKQDLPGSLTGDRLRRRLRIEDAVPIVAASALTTAGVFDTLSLATRLALSHVSDEALEPFVADLARADSLFDHVLTFEDNPVNDEPVDAEELNIAADDAEVSADVMAAHLTASSLDSLEARARRAAERARSADPS
jgi:signal recognition particle receptor subunit beta